MNYACRGGDPTGRRQCGSYLQEALADMRDHSSLTIPAGIYDLSDVTTGFVLPGSHRAVVCPDGVATLNFGGGMGILLANADQSDLSFVGLRLENAQTYLGIQGSGRQHRKDLITLYRCGFVNADVDAAVLGLYLRCRAQGIRVDHCDFINLACSGDFSSVGAWIGLKGDSGSRDPDPAGEFDYGEDETAGSAEAAIWVTNCLFRSITTASTSTNQSHRENHALLIDGWRATVHGNVFDTIVSAADDDSEGLYMRVRDGVVANNHFRDAGSTAYVNHKGPKSTVKYHDNSYRTASVVPRDIMEITNSGADITGETFRKCRAERAIIDGSSVADDVHVDGNTFDGCQARRLVSLRGSRCHETRSRVINRVETVE